MLAVETQSCRNVTVGIPKKHQPESSGYKTEPLVSGYVTPDILRPSVQLELELELEVQVEKLSLKLIVAIKSCDHMIGNRPWQP